MTVSTLTGVTVSLEAGCDEPCSQFAFPLWKQLRHGYEVCSVLPVPESAERWRQQHRTARKRANRAATLGYQAREIKREDYSDDVFEINTSLAVRQGKPMTAGYRERPNFLPLPDYLCPLHAIRTYGTVDVRGRLVAYLWLYRSGELALVSSILGHGDHLGNDVMYLLFQAAVEREAEHGGYFVYNRDDSGTDGLRYFKAKLGFEAAEVTWVL